MDGISIPLLVALAVVQPGHSISSHAGPSSYVVVPARNILHMSQPHASPGSILNARHQAVTDSTPMPVYIPSVTYHPDGWGAHSRLAGDQFRW
ncbi:hypothetical protein BVI2075_280063 [Burkholderia vietnamiensis]|nr:hypothetical protein BVI2075_280063 [Burkholderia vietnamiensis]